MYNIIFILFADDTNIFCSRRSYDTLVCVYICFIGKKTSVGKPLLEYMSNKFNTRLYAMNTSWREPGALDEERARLK